MNPTTRIKGFTALDVLSYSLDLGAAYWLASLRAGGSSIARFTCDPAAFRPWFPRNGAGSGILSVRPARTSALFHPKVWKIARGKHISWIISTANISIPESKTARNFFIALSRCRAADDAWRTLCGGKSSVIVIDAMRVRVRASGQSLRQVLWPLVSEVAAAKGRCVVASSAGVSKKLLSDLLGQRHIAHVRAFVGGEAIRAVPKISQANGTKIEFVAPRTRREPDLHGKLFYCENSKWAVLYVGSANFTWAAYNGVNIEAGVILRDKRQRLAPVVRMLLAGRWKGVKPNPSASEPADEADDHGSLQRCLAQCVTVQRGADGSPRRLLIEPRRLKKKRRCQILRVMLIRRSAGERLGVADSANGWTLDLHADALDQELLFVLAGRPAETLWLAALVFNDTAAEVGKGALSLEDIFRPVRRRSRRVGRHRKGKAMPHEGGADTIDVRFPWHVLGRLMEWSGDRRVAAIQYARKLIRDGDGTLANRLHAAIIQEVVFAADGTKT